MEAAGHTWEESAWGSEVKFKHGSGPDRTEVDQSPSLQSLAHEASVVRSLHWIALKLFDVAEAAEFNETILAANPTLGVAASRDTPASNVIGVFGGSCAWKTWTDPSWAGRDCKGATSPPSSDCYRSRDGNRTQHPTEDASVLFPGSGRRLMKLPH